jgi:hypothetical protein
MEYVKYFYWVSPAEIQGVLEDLKAKLDKNDIPKAQIRQCESLNSTTTIMHVPPEVWSANCKRQGSWFRTSDRAQDHLIVVNQPLDLDHVLQHGIIRLITVNDYPSFTREKIPELLTTPTFTSRVQKEWFEYLPSERPLYQGYIDRYKLGVTLDEFLTFHSANHANFLLPRQHAALYCTLEGESIVCSLFAQEFTCSACMQLFGILGLHHEKMIIKKCPGLKYVSLKPNEFLLVQHSKNI